MPGVHQAPPPWCLQSSGGDEKTQRDEQVNYLFLEDDSGQRKRREGDRGPGVGKGEGVGQNKTLGESICGTLQGGGERVG